MRGRNPSASVACACARARAPRAMHKGFDRNNAKEAAFAWMRGVMYDEEWAQPPSARPLDYIPVGARPLFQTLFTEMLQWLDRYPDDVERWFMLVRVWPRLVCAPLRRGGGNAAEQLYP